MISQGKLNRTIDILQRKANELDDLIKTIEGDLSSIYEKEAFKLVCTARSATEEARTYFQAQRVENEMKRND